MQKAKIIFKSSDKENAEMLLFGTYFEKDGQSVLRFFEESEENGKTLSTLTAKNGVIGLERRGELSMNLTFCEGNEHSFDIVTKYGSIPSKLLTIRANAAKCGNIFSVELCYDLLTFGEAQNHSISISAELI